MMNRRDFLRSLFASSSVIVVAPACVLEDLPRPPGDPHRTYVDMGRRRSALVWLDPLDAIFGPAAEGSLVYAIDGWWRWQRFEREPDVVSIVERFPQIAIIGVQQYPDGVQQHPDVRSGVYLRANGRWRPLETDPLPNPPPWSRT